MNRHATIVGDSPFAPILSPDALVLLGRLLLASPFVLFGVQKYLHTAYMMAYIERGGLPGVLIWPVIVLQVAGGLAIAVGYQTRIAAFLLGGFSILATAIYHTDWSVRGESAQFMKDLAMTGAFLFLWSFGPGRWSVDAVRARRGAAAP